METDAKYTYSNGWTNVTHATNYSGGSTKRATVNGSEITFDFAGSELGIYAAKGTMMGKYNVYLDEDPTPVLVLDGYGTASAFQKLYGTLTVPEGPHTVRLKAVITSPATTLEFDYINVKGRAPKITKWFRNTTQGATTQTTSYSYDSLGRRITAFSPDETIDYTWAGSRLGAISDNADEVSYVYDGDGQRISKTTTQAEITTKTSYIYDGLSLLALSSTSEMTTKNLTYLYSHKSSPVGALYRSSDTSQTIAFEIVSDMRGDVREMRDSAGDAFARFDYDAYGNIRAEQVFATSLIDEVAAQEIVEIQPLRYA
ncbi:MAG: hypothetical protein FWE87_04865, partial [Coriobacteriia bacterium]|nr:hypothetical protein [Coriobacteriia bacterium]